jgi:hypothetical protein
MTADKRRPIALAPLSIAVSRLLSAFDRVSIIILFIAVTVLLVVGLIVSVVVGD